MKTTNTETRTARRQALERAVRRCQRINFGKPAVTYNGRARRIQSAVRRLRRMGY